MDKPNFDTRPFERAVYIRALAYADCVVFDTTDDEMWLAKSRNTGETSSPQQILRATHGLEPFGVTTLPEGEITYYCKKRDLSFIAEMLYRDIDHEPKSFSTCVDDRVFVVARQFLVMSECRSMALEQVTDAGFGPYTLSDVYEPEFDDVDSVAILPPSPATYVEHHSV